MVAVSSLDRRQVFAALAPVIFVLLWSTGFIGARFGLPYAQPFTLLLMRFSLSALLMVVLSVAIRATWPTRREGLHSMVAGLLLHAVYIGGVFTAINLGMPAGVTSLVVGTQPVLTAILAQIALREQISPRQWLGLALGFAGVGLVVGEKLLAHTTAVQDITVAGMASALCALVGNTVGTLYQRRFCVNVPLTTGTAFQYAATSVVMLVLALSTETMHVVWSPTLILTLLWLVLALSFGAIMLLFWLLRQNAASRVSSLFYLVPPFTALEAYFLFNEQLGLLAIGGMVLAVIGVALVLGRRTGSKPQTHEEHEVQF